MATSNNNNNMETPPASPPRFGKSATNSDVVDGNPHPDLVAGTVSLSPIETVQESSSVAVSTTAMDSPTTSSSVGEEEKRGHIRIATPSTPISVEAYAQDSTMATTMSSSSAAAQQRAFSTPGRSNVSGEYVPMQVGGQGYHHQGHHLMSDLTPVISNSNAMYVDSNNQGNHARMMPGLTSSAFNTSIAEGPGQGGEYMVVSPPSNNTLNPRGSGSSSRRTRMPMPRAGLPPAKRSSIENSNHTRSSSNASSGSSLRGDQQRDISPSTPLSLGSESKDGLGGLIGERLAMPSYGSLNSEDESMSSNGSVGRVIQTTSSAIFKQKEPKLVPASLAPIELKPDRKFFSFQGSSQYKHAMNDEADPSSSSKLETIQSPSRGRPPMTPSKKDEQQPMLAGMHSSSRHNQQSAQYQPPLRSQHGVTEMADTSELNAIFKAPRSAHGASKLVTPHNTPASTALAGMTEGGGGTSMMMQDSQPSFPPREDAKKFGGGLPSSSNQHLQQPYPVDEREWSIPSIRLANHVNLSSNNLLNYSHGSYTDFSEYTDDDESYYSFLGDDDDASLSSRGSVDVSTRRRRFLRASLEMAASQAPNLAELAAANESLDSASSSQPPAIGQSNSFLEKIQGISIENAANTATAASSSTIPLPKRANTFDSEIMMIDGNSNDELDINEPPPILNVNAASSRNNAMDDADYHQSRRRRHNRGQRSSRRRKEGAAMGWIQDLQNQSKNDVQLIAESASSKFMSGIATATTAPVGQTKGMTSEDVAKALGMPHALCRSSTIEAGPFTVGIHRGVAFGQSGTNGPDIALTSSGSGD